MTRSSPQSDLEGTAEHKPPRFVDLTEQKRLNEARKIAAVLAHTSQFPDGETNLDWLKSIDGEVGATIQATAAEAFKSMRVW